MRLSVCTNGTATTTPLALAPGGSHVLAIQPTAKLACSTSGLDPSRRMAAGSFMGPTAPRLEPLGGATYIRTSHRLVELAAKSLSKTTGTAFMGRYGK